MAIELEITAGVGPAFDSFNAKLFRNSYWRFIRLTSLKEKQAAQALVKLLEMRELDQHTLNTALRPWFADTAEGDVWKDLEFQTMRTAQRGGKPHTRIQDIDALVTAIVSRYAFYQMFNLRLQLFKERGFKPLAAVEVRLNCPIHSGDEWKIVEPVSYIKKKPMRESLQCSCWLDWAPSSKRYYGKWKERVMKHRTECQNPR